MDNINKQLHRYAMQLTPAERKIKQQAAAVAAAHGETLKQATIRLWEIYVRRN